jgi:hypothetical protein
MSNVADDLRDLHRAAMRTIDALHALWIDRGGGFKDLQGRTIGDHFSALGQIAFWLSTRIETLGDAFALLARASRQPRTIGFVSGSSMTEITVRHCHQIVQGTDSAVRTIRLMSPDGLKDEEKEYYSRSWKNLREPYDNSGWIPTAGRCMEMAAEVEWELPRALGLLPQTPRRPVLTAPGTIEVFFSYSHKDEKHKDSLLAHLSQLKHENKIRDWHDRKIGAGTEWAGQIDEHLNSAQVILLLVSSDFLASRYCYDVEMNRAMERHEAREARVIPIIVRPCDWHSAPFGKLQALPTDGKPVTDYKSRDEAFTVIAKGIRAAIAGLLKPEES